MINKNMYNAYELINGHFIKCTIIYLKPWIVALALNNVEMREQLVAVGIFLKLIYHMMKRYMLLNLPETYSAKNGNRTHFTWQLLNVRHNKHYADLLQFPNTSFEML